MSTSAEKGYHHGGLQAALIQAALDMLSEGGAEAMSLRAVARRAGVSAMAPYRHYAGKEALLAAVAVHGFVGLRGVLQAADASVPAERALVAQAQGYVGYALENPALFRLMFGPRRLGLHPALTAASDATYAVLALRVEQNAKADVDCGVRALGYWSLVHGLACLFLDGCIEEKTAAPHVDVTRRVAEAMLMD